MAPPTRTYGTAPAATTSSDPLASLMAPPPVRIPSQTTLSSGPPGGPPIRRVAAAPSTKVWTPPVNIMKPNPVPSTLSDPFSQFSTTSIEQSSINGNDQTSFQSSNGINNPTENFTQNDQFNSSQQQQQQHDGVSSSLPPPPLQFNQYSQYGIQTYPGQFQGGSGFGGVGGGGVGNENDNNYSLPPPPL